MENGGAKVKKESAGRREPQTRRNGKAPNPSFSHGGRRRATPVRLSLPRKRPGSGHEAIAPIQRACENEPSASHCRASEKGDAPVAREPRIGKNRHSDLNS